MVFFLSFKGHVFKIGLSLSLFLAARMSYIDNPQASITRALRLSLVRRSRNMHMTSTTCVVTQLTNCCVSLFFFILSFSSSVCFLHISLVPQPCSLSSLYNFPGIPLSVPSVSNSFKKNQLKSSVSLKLISDLKHAVK